MRCVHVNVCVCVWWDCYVRYSYIQYVSNFAEKKIARQFDYSKSNISISGRSSHQPHPDIERSNIHHKDSKLNSKNAYCNVCSNKVQYAEYWFAKCYQCQCCNLGYNSGCCYAECFHAACSGTSQSGQLAAKTFRMSEKRFYFSFI